MSGLMLHAQPYDLDAAGFYFRSLEDYEKKAEKNLNRYGQLVEEYELQVIDGTDYFCAEPYQCNLSSWFEQEEVFSGLSELEQKVVTWLVEDLRKTPQDALDTYEDVSLHEGTASDYAYGFAEDCLDLSGVALQYFDTEAFARDMRLNGELVEIERELWVTNPQDL